MGETLPGNIAHGWYDTDNDLEYEDFFSIQRTPFASGIGGECIGTSLARIMKVITSNPGTKTSLNQKSQIKSHENNVIYIIII